MDAQPQVNPEVFNSMMKLLDQSGANISLAACMYWIFKHDKGGMPNTPAQLQRRIDAYDALDADAKQAWYEVSAGIAGAICTTLAQHARAESGKLWTPGTGVPSGN